VASDGSVYVTEPHHGALRRIAPDGAVSTLLVDDTGIGGVAVGPDDSIYLSNMVEGTISKWVDGQAQVIVNQARVPGDRTGSVGSAALRPGEGLFLDGSHLVIADMGNYRLREFDVSCEQLSTLAGDGEAGLEVGVTATSHMVLPRGVTRYRDGYAVADTGNHRILFVRR
jgi:hypothetical protein